MSEEGGLSTMISLQFLCELWVKSYQTSQFCETAPGPLHVLWETKWKVLAMAGASFPFSPSRAAVLCNQM